MPFLRALLLVLTVATLHSPSFAQGTIEGAVVSATNGQLLPRATVYLRNVKKRTDVSSSRADGHAHFVFQGIDEGTYEITAERQGFFYDSRRGPLQAPIDVQDGAHIKGIVVRLLPFAAVTGRIVDDYEDPIERAQVRLLAVQYFRGHPTLNNIGTAFTDDRGEYRISGVRPGNYYVVAEFDPYRNRRNNFGTDVKSQQPELAFPPLFYPATSDVRQAQRLPVAAGAEVYVKFAFVSVPSVSIEGRVVNGMTGELIKKPAIVVYWGDMRGGITRRVELSENGSFKVEGVSPGPFTLVTSATEDEINYSDVRVVEVGATGLKDLEIPVMPDFDIKGQVRLDAVNNQRDIPRFAVEFAHMEKGSNIFRVNADKPRFEFSSKLHPGDHYKVSVPNLPEDYYLKSVLVSGHEAPNADVAIYGPHAEMELVVSPTGGHIDGKALNSKGEPVSSYILLTPDVDRVPSESIRFTRSDTKGKFVLRGIPPGSYRLYALEDVDTNELINQPDLLKSFENEAQLVRIEEGGKYELEVKPAAAVAVGP